MTTGKPLTAAEVAELDSYGELSGVQLMLGTMPERAAELWEREILYGRADTKARGFAYLVKRRDRR